MTSTATRYLADSTCLIAVMCRWHVHHAATAAEMERRARAGEELVVAAHSLLECYAVLTRLPDPHLLAPGVALQLIETNWGSSPIVALSGGDVRALLQRAAGKGTTGGQLYDAVIAASALKGRATTILTWNVRHFAKWADAIPVVAPAAP